LVLLACVGWVALTRDPGTAVEAAPPATTTSTSATAISIASTAGSPATASPSPTPPPRTTTTPPRPTSPSPTAKRTPGPGEVEIPDVTGMYPDPAWYAIYSAGLNPVIVVHTVPDKCSVKETIPAKGEIVKLNSTVQIISEQDTPTCQPA